jgi:hypothetical protein
VQRFVAPVLAENLCVEIARKSVDRFGVVRGLILPLPGDYFPKQVFLTTYRFPAPWSLFPFKILASAPVLVYSFLSEPGVGS